MLQHTFFCSASHFRINNLGFSNQSKYSINVTHCKKRVCKLEVAIRLYPNVIEQQHYLTWAQSNKTLSFKRF
jgi:hypothetical protein